MDLTAILEKTISPNQSELQEALRHLEQAAADNLPQLLSALSAVLKDPTKSVPARMQAGLQLKNFLYSKDQTLRGEYQNRWLALEEIIRVTVRQNALETLGSEQSRPSSAAQCVAYIACIELPHMLWPDLIMRLVQNVTELSSTELLKEATLEAIGYICQDIDPDILKMQANQILTAIVSGMKKEESSNSVKLAATRALLNSLEFTKANFEKDSERHYIMQVVCEATQCPETSVKVAALQCLVKIMSLYYQYMETYMGPALFAITMEAMSSDVDEICLQGIEFWSNVCDEEMDLSIEASEAEEMGRPPDRTSRFYAKGALQYLVPILLNTLTKQEEHDDEDEWNPCKASGVCLMLMAQCCEDDLVGFVLPFVTQHVTNPDWKFRDAAIMAFGSILEGPNPTTLKPVCQQALGVVITLLKDSSVVVRDTAAWTVGRVCEMLPEVVIEGNELQQLLTALVEGLAAEPRVAANVCWALSSLAEAAYEAAEAQTEDEEPQTYILSQYFEPIVEKLLATTDRADGHQGNLRSGAYEALMGMVKNSPKDCYAAVQKTTIIILERLQQVLELEQQISSSSDRSQFNDLQSLLCATLQSVLRKVTPVDVPQISDAIMTALLRMFNNSDRSGGVHEDAMLAVSTLVEVLGEGFQKYMDLFKPFLIMGLKNHAEYQVCLAAVGVVGDLSRALSRQILPHCDEIMTLLCANLGDATVHRSVKPQILSVFGDIALAIGPEYRKYLEVVLTTLQQASMAQVDRSDYDMIDYLNELRESCLEAYTGIVQGLKGDTETPSDPSFAGGDVNHQTDVRIVQHHVPHMLNFVEQISVDEDKSDAVVAACCGLVGDLVTAFGTEILGACEKEPVQSLLVNGRRSKVGKTKQLAVWATKEIRKLKNQQQVAS